MINYNFWIMDIVTSGLIFASAILSERRQRNRQEEKRKLSLTDEFDEKPSETVQEIRINLPYYVLFNAMYFAAMALVVLALRYFPTYIIYAQHLAVVGFIIVAFDGWLRPSLAYPLGIFFSVMWFLSAKTSYRWLLNNLIIAIFTLMIGDIQFKNFAVLQIFMWSAFVYDVCILAQGNLGTAHSIFSVTLEECKTLMCDLFHIHDQWELPSVFTVKLGNESQVFLGTGDILLGALVVNFSKSFFKSTKYVIAVVLSYSLAVGLLNQVDSIPFPALASIVPICTLAIVVCAVVSGRTKQLFSLDKKTTDKSPLGLTIA